MKINTKSLNYKTKQTRVKEKWAFVKLLMKILVPMFPVSTWVLLKSCLLAFSEFHRPSQYPTTSYDSFYNPVTI